MIRNKVPPYSSYVYKHYILGMNNGDRTSTAHVYVYYNETEIFYATLNVYKCKLFIIPYNYSDTIDFFKVCEGFVWTDFRYKTSEISEIFVKFQSKLQKLLEKVAIKICKNLQFNLFSH